ncbi:MAG: chitinase [Verrucomicrobiales bacterium]|nr:chitinase [Verrucomicrobiales bacterium]|tara:strand:+ start:463 stop:1509 length:1047 start_codon:yes stop_codon:yes gene_type:complete
MRVLLACLFAFKLSAALPQPALSRANPWPVQVFAPYVDATLWPTFDFSAATRQQGLRFYTLAFIVAKGANNPAPSWGGYHLISKKWLLPEINAIRMAGGEVMVSFGGAAGTGLAAACKTPGQLQAAYQMVIDAYGLTHIDFDVEGFWLAEPKSIERRSRAIAGLQAQARHAKRPLRVWFTLPALPSGLTREGMGILRSALRHGVAISGVNVMAMNYGRANAPKPMTDMGTYAIRAATSLHAQLKDLHRESGIRKTDAQVWSMVGLTPMLGRNDVKPETFTLDNAREVLAFARQKRIGLLSCWSANRDRPPSKSGLDEVSPKHSGMDQEMFGFAKIFRRYGVKNPNFIE